MNSTLTQSLNLHKQSVYIVLDDSGKYHVIQHAPTMNYAGRKDSDQYSLMLGLFIDDISHDLWLGDVNCHLNVHSSSGIQTNKNIKATIVAKKQFTWDMNKPIGERESNSKVTKNFDTLINHIRSIK